MVWTHGWFLFCKSKIVERALNTHPNLGRKIDRVLGNVIYSAKIPLYNANVWKKW